MTQDRYDGCRDFSRYCHSGRRLGYCVHSIEKGMVTNESAKCRISAYITNVEKFVAGVIRRESGQIAREANNEKKWPTLSEYRRLTTECVLGTKMPAGPGNGHIFEEDFQTVAQALLDETDFLGFYAKRFSHHMPAELFAEFAAR